MSRDRDLLAVTDAALVDFGSLARITVLRALPGLGDMLCLVPALRSLRRCAPNARITIVGLESSRWMLARYSRLIDAMISVSYWPGVPEAAGARDSWPATCAAWRDSLPDLALQMHGSGLTSNQALLSLPAREHAGHHPSGTAPPGRLFRPWPTRGHESQRLLGLARWLGAPDADGDLAFPVWPRDTAAVRRLAAIDAPYACVHPGASRPDRRWSRDKFARVSDHLAQRGLRVFITGSAAERELALGVASDMREPAEVVAGRTELGTLAALLRGAQIVVSNDTGVAHLAAAVDTHAVVVFTTSDPDRWRPQPSPRRRSIISASSPAVDEVISAVNDLMVSA